MKISYAIIQFILITLSVSWTAFAANDDRLTVYTDLFKNLGQSSEADVLRLYFSEKNRSFFRHNNYLVYDADTVASKYKTEYPGYLPGIADYTVTGSYYIFADLIEITVNISGRKIGNKNRTYFLKTRVNQLDADYSKVLLNIGKEINPGFSDPNDGILFSSKFTQQWLNAKYADYFPDSPVPKTKLKDGWDSGGNRTPEYTLQYVRELLDDAMLQSNEAFRKSRLEFIEMLVVQLYIKYPEHSEVIAACAEISLFNKKRYSVAENFARKGIKIDPLNATHFLMLMISLGLKSGEGKQAYLDMLKVNPFLDAKKFSIDRINFRNGLFNTYLEQSIESKVTIPEPIETDMQMRFDYAKILLQNGHTKEALKELLLLNETYPARDELVNATAQAYNTLNDPSQVQERLTFLLGALPGLKNPEPLYLEIAELYFNAKTFDMAGKYYEKHYIPYYKSVTELQLEKMTQSFIYAKAFDKALFYAKKLVLKSPNNPDAFYYAALSAVETGDIEQTEKILSFVEQKKIAGDRFEEIKNNLAKKKAAVQKPKTEPDKK